MKPVSLFKRLLRNAGCYANRQSLHHFATCMPRFRAHGLQKFPWRSIGPIVGWAREVLSAWKRQLPAISARHVPTLYACLIVLAAGVFLFAVVGPQYARAVGVTRIERIGPISLPHASRAGLLSPKWDAGDGVNSFQSAPFTVKVLCPVELGFLIRAVARGVQLSSFIAGMYRFLSGAAGLKSDMRRSIIAIFSGATTFGVGCYAPTVVRSIACFSLGYAPF